MENRIYFATKALIAKDGKILLIMKSEKDNVNPNMIDIPGGRLEYGETPINSLKREVKEETSLDIEVIKPVNCWSFVDEKKKFQLVGVTFYCLHIGGRELLSHEHKDLFWIDIDDILAKDYPSWLKNEVKNLKRIVKL